MSHKKLDLSQRSKLSMSAQNEMNDIGIISRKNSTTIKSFRLRKTDIDKINGIKNSVNEINERGNYNGSDIIRGALYFLSVQDTETIRENIQKSK
jgi:hypothetical protein